MVKIIHPTRFNNKIALSAEKTYADIPLLTFYLGIYKYMPKNQSCQDTINVINEQLKQYEQNKIVNIADIYEQRDPKYIITLVSQLVVDINECWRLPLSPKIVTTMDLLNQTCWTLFFPALIHIFTEIAHAAGDIYNTLYSYIFDLYKCSELRQIHIISCLAVYEYVNYISGHKITPYNITANIDKDLTNKIIEIFKNEK